MILNYYLLLEIFVLTHTENSVEASPPMSALSRLHPHNSLCSQVSLDKTTMHPAFPDVASLSQVFGCLVESWVTTDLKILETKAIAYAAWVAYQELCRMGQAHRDQRL